MILRKSDEVMASSASIVATAMMVMYQIECQFYRVIANGTSKHIITINIH